VAENPNSCEIKITKHKYNFDLLFFNTMKYTSRNFIHFIHLKNVITNKMSHPSIQSVLSYSKMQVPH